MTRLNAYDPGDAVFKPLTIAEQRDPIAMDSTRASFEAAVRDRDRPVRSVEEVKLAASPIIGDHRRRILEHLEKVEAEQRSPPAAEPSEPQLRIPLIGEVRRPEPPAPKRKPRRAKKPIQPDLGEF